MQSKENFGTFLTYNETVEKMPPAECGRELAKRGTWGRPGKFAHT